MRPIATYVIRIAWSVCLCFGHTGKLCKNGWTDRDAIWGADSCGSKEPWGPDTSKKEGTFEGDMCRTIVTYLRMSALRWPRANVPAHAAAECIGLRLGWQRYGLSLMTCLSVNKYYKDTDVHLLWRRRRQQRTTSTMVKTSTMLPQMHATMTTVSNDNASSSFDSIVVASTHTATVL